MLMIVGFGLYSLSSYLVLMRDAFILERLGKSTGWEWLEPTLLQVANLLKVNHTSIGLLALSLFLLTWSYLTLVAQAGKSKSLSWKTLMLVWALVFVSFPSLSTDVFDYTNTNRVVFLHQADPWVYPAITFSSDPDIYFGSWIDRASVYPPANMLANSLVYALFGYNVIPSVVGFKLLASLMYLLVIWALYRFVKLRWDQVVLFAFNPLILIEFVGNAHNDLYMGVLLLFSVIFVARSSILSAALLAWATLAKVTAALAMPAIFITHLNHKRFMSLVGWLAVYVCLVLLGFMAIGDSLEPYMRNLADQNQLYQKSWPTVWRDLSLWLLGQHSFVTAALIEKGISLSLFVIGGGLVTLIWRKRPVELVAAYLLVYLLTYSPMMQPWYMAWVLVFLPMLGSLTLRRILVAMSLWMLWIYPVYYLSLFYQPQHPIWQAVFSLMTSLPVLAILVNRPRVWLARLTQMAYNDWKSFINYLKSYA